MHQRSGIYAHDLYCRQQRTMLKWKHLYPHNDLYSWYPMWRRLHCNAHNTNTNTHWDTVWWESSPALWSRLSVREGARYELRTWTKLLWNMCEESLKLEEKNIAKLLRMGSMTTCGLFQTTKVNFVDLKG